MRADINSYELEGTYDIIYSSGSLTFIKPENRDALFEDYRKHTSSGGLHAFNVFINKPSLGTPPDWGDKEYFFGTGELVSYYQDWNVIKIEEETFSCNSGGIPHRHAMETMISVKNSVWVLQVPVILRISTGRGMSVRLIPTLRHRLRVSLRSKRRVSKT